MTDNLLFLKSLSYPELFIHLGFIKIDDINIPATYLTYRKLKPDIGIVYIYTLEYISIEFTLKFKNKITTYHLFDTQVNLYNILAILESFNKETEVQLYIND